MKKLILVLFFVLGLAYAVNAEKATWNTSEGAAGYYLYVKQGETEKHYTINGGDVSEYVFNIVPGDYEFSITAFNSAGESERSETVLYTVAAYQPKESNPPDEPKPPEKPTGFELIKIGVSQILNGIKDLFS